MLCAIVAATVSPGAAQDRHPTAAGIEDDFDRIDRMLNSIDSLPEWDHDALLFRIDDQILSLHAELAAMADQLAAQAADTTEFTETRMALEGWMERAVELSTTRITELNERIHVELSTHDDFADTPNAIISRAFVQDLRNVRLRHVNSTLDQLDRMETLGFSGVDAVREPLEESLDLTAQRFVGQIRLDSMTLEELRERVAADPDNPTLRTALRAVERKQMASLDTLSNVIALQARIGETPRSCARCRRESAA
jgi:hypothetical protein